MSVHAMSWVLRHSDARLGARLVLLKLADECRGEGDSAWPSTKTIAHETRMSIRQVKRCLRQLETDGMIVAEGKSRHGTTIYRILMDSPKSGDDELPSPESGDGVTNPTAGGDKSGKKAVVNVTRTRSKPTKEPEKNTSDASDMREIFDYWVAAMGKTAATQFDDTRKAKVRARLKKFTVAQIKHAIDGCANSPFHRGANDSGTQHIDLTLICRNDAKLAEFMQRRDDQLAKPNTNGAPTRRDRHRLGQTRLDDEAIFGRQQRS